MHSEQATILVVDDERSVTALLSKDMTEKGYNCVTAVNGEDALKTLSMDNVDAMVLDLKLPGISGIDVLKETKRNHPEIAVIIITGAGDTETAVEVMKLGATDYITKPFELEKVNSCIEATLESKTVPSSAPTPREEDAEASGQESVWIRHLDNIARGVEARFDLLTSHVMNITNIEETITIAQSLDIPDDQIEKWADARRRNIERLRTLDRFLQKM